MRTQYSKSLPDLSQLLSSVSLLLHFLKSEPLGIIKVTVFCNFPEC